MHPRVMPGPWILALVLFCAGPAMARERLAVHVVSTADFHAADLVLGQLAVALPEAAVLAREAGTDVWASHADRIAVLRASRAGASVAVDVEIRTAAGRRLDRFVLTGHGEPGLRAALAETAARLRATQTVLLAEAEHPPDREEFPELVREEEGESPAPAPPADDTNGPPRIAELRVVGNRRIEADAILAAVGSRRGDFLRARRIGQDIRRIYALGFFRNVEVRAENVSGGVALIYAVEENPVIRRVTVSGNDNLGSDDIKEKMTLTVGSTVDYPLLLENAKRIEALYEVEGYYLAEARYEIEPLQEGAVSINYDLKEGEKLRLQRIEFNGNEALDDDELMDVVQTKPWGFTSYLSSFWDNSGLYAEPIFFQDLDRISRMYMDEGFIRVSVGEPEVDISEDGIVVDVDIIEGPRYEVGEVDVIGDPSMDRQVLFDLAELDGGQVFSRGTLSDDVERLRAFYADRGFFSASVVPRTQVNPDTLTVDVGFEVEKGDLFFIDRIEVTGNTRTRDDVIRRELSLAEGEMFSAGAMARSRLRVRRLGYFEEVNVETRPGDLENSVEVAVDVVERPTGQFSFGAGFGSTDGFLLNGSLSQDNLFGEGRAVSISADVGSRNTSQFFIRWVEPYAFGSSASLSTSFSQIDREFVNFDESIMGFNLGLSYPLDEGDTFAGTGYSFSRREVEEFNDFQAASLLQREEFQGESTTSLISLSLRQDTRDDVRFPRNGYAIGAAAEFAGVGGLNQFVRLEARGTWYYPLAEYVGFDSTFVVNSRIGWVLPLNSIGDFDLPGCTGTVGDNSTCIGFSALSPEIQPLTDIDDDLKLPLTERYFLGGLGAFQVRGFDQRSLGPRRSIITPQKFGEEATFFPSGTAVDLGTGTTSCNGICNSLTDTDIDDFDNLDLADVIGGNKMFLVNLEMQFPISEELGLRGLLFLDAGNAFAENENINPADLRFGTGFGVQWLSPFGPILVILGIPLDALDDEDATVFEFSLGGSSF